MMKKSMLVIACCITQFMFAQSLSQGIELYKAGKLKEAKDFFQKQPATDQTYYYLGRIAFDDGQFEKAMDYFEEAIEENYKVSDYFLWLGHSTGSYALEANYFKQGILAPRVKTAYETAVSLDPENIDAHWGLIDYYTLAPGVLGGSWEKAEVTGNNIKKINQLEGHDALARVYERQQEFEKAEQEYIMATKLDQSRAIKLGKFYMKREENEKALIWIDRAIENNANFDNLYTKVHWFLKNNNEKEAIEISDRAAMFANINQLNSLGYFWLGRNEIDKAIEYFVLNVDQNPSDPNVHDSLGEAYKAKGMNSEAILMFRKSLALNPPSNTKENSIKLLKELGVEVND